MFVVLVLLSCMAINPGDTVRAVTIAFVLGFLAWGVLIVIRLRKRYEKRRPVHRPAMAATQRAREVFAADEGTIGKAPTLVLEKQPQLEGVPQNVLANLLAGKMGCSAAEISARLKLSPDQGSIVLPDTFAALIREREPIP